MPHKPTTEQVNEYMKTDFQKIVDMLLLKNTQYNNAALDPIHVFSTADPLAQCKVRIDDKLKRLQNWFQKPENEVTVESVFQNEDTISDIIGYFLLMRAHAHLVYSSQMGKVDQAQPEDPGRVIDRLMQKNTTQADTIEVLQEAVCMLTAKLDRRKKRAFKIAAKKRATTRLTQTARKVSRRKKSNGRRKA